MTTFKKLALPALVVPATGVWNPILLGAESVVELVRNDEGPLGLPGEQLVRYLDHEQTTREGFLSSTATFSESARKLTALTTVRPDGTMRATDTMRMRMLSERHVRWQPQINGPWTPLGWFGRFGLQEETAEMLKAVVREHGGILPRSATSSDVLTRALRIIFRKEVPMSEVQEAAAPAKTATKRAAKKGATKKGATKAKTSTAKHAKPDAPARSMSRTVGNTLTPLLEKAGAKRETLALAKRLSHDEELGKRDLTHLRDAVNEHATAARSENKGALASSLSAANRLVRRLARKA